MSRARVRAPRYGSPRAIAHHLGLSETTVRGLIARGVLRAHRVGRRVLVSYADAGALVERS